MQCWRCKPWLTINIDPSGRIVQPCYVLNEYKGDLKVWDVDIRKVWIRFKSAQILSMGTLFKNKRLVYEKL